MALTSPRGSNVLQYQCTRSIRFVWAGWRSRHEALCDDHDDLNLNRASDLFESLLGVHIQRLLLSLSHSHVLVLSIVQFFCSGFIYCLLSCPPPPSFSDFFFFKKKINSKICVFFCITVDLPGWTKFQQAIY